MTGSERSLALLLRIVGVLSVSAIVPACMPFAWMETIHEGLGLGELPNAKITHYLTRSLSLFYAAHGALMIFVSYDVPRYLPVLRMTAWIAFGFGIGLLAIDLSAGLPWFWVALEGPFPIVCGVVLLVLTSRVEEKHAS